MSLLAAVLVASTSLHITVWPNGADKPGKHEYTLRCAPAGGTLPHRATACRSLLRLRTPFAPTPKGSACAQIYGGPQTALVTGRPARQPSPCGLQPEGRLRDREMEPRPVPLPRQPLLVAQQPRTPARLR